MKTHLLIPKLAILFWVGYMSILFEALLCEPLVKLKTCPNYIICLPSMLSSPRFYGQQQCKYFPQITKQQKAALLCPKMEIQSKAGQFKDNYQVGAMPCHPPCVQKTGRWSAIRSPHVNFQSSSLLRMWIAMITCKFANATRKVFRLQNGISPRAITNA